MSRMDAAIAAVSQKEISLRSPLTPSTSAMYFRTLPRLSRMPEPHFPFAPFQVIPEPLSLAPPSSSHQFSVLRSEPYRPNGRASFEKGDKTANKQSGAGEPLKRESRTD